MTSIADLATIECVQPSVSTDGWAQGRQRKAASWRISDLHIVDADGIYRMHVKRRLVHYGTVMLELEGKMNLDLRPTFTTVSYFNPGWGSVSDQQGVNKFLAAAGLPDRYKSLRQTWARQNG
jgi:hypothetical protein